MQETRHLAGQFVPAKWWWAGLLVLAMVGCQSAAPTVRHDEGRFLQQQALRSEGFVPTDQGWELQMPGKLLFEFDSAELEANAQARIVELGRALKSVGIDRLRIEGHTDDRGSKAYNLRLSQRRAEAVAHWLVQAGMARDQLDVQGLGNTQPVDPNNPAENRRVAIIVPAP